MDKQIIRVDCWYQILIKEFDNNLIEEKLIEENMGGTMFLEGGKICVSMDANVETDEDFTDVKIVCRSEMWDTLKKYQKIVEIVKELQLKYLTI